jgi:hypothetical protein
MKLEHGKRYITRGGLITGVVTHHPNYINYPFLVEACDYPYSVTAEGFYSFDRHPNNLDLVAEYDDNQGR